MTRCPKYWNNSPRNSTENNFKKSVSSSDATSPENANVTDLIQKNGKIGNFTVNSETNSVQVFSRTSWEIWDTEINGKLG